MMTSSPLTQEALTKIARDKGRTKVRKEWRDAKNAGAENRTRTGNAAVREIVDGLMDFLADDLEALQAGRPVPHGKSLRYLTGAPISEVCLAVARSAVNGMTRAEWVSGISMQARLGAAAEDAVLEALWRRLDPDQAAAARAHIGYPTDPLKRRLARKAFLMGWAGDIIGHGEGWSERTTKTVGAAFMDYLVRLGMFEHHKAGVGSNRRRTNGVRLTERATHWISNAVEHDVSSAEVLYPTIDPPIPWTKPYGCGLHGRGEVDHPAIPRNQRPLWIVKNARKEHKALLLKADLGTVYAAINAAQATGWRINKRVYAVFEEFRRSGKGEAGLALADRGEKPERPLDADTNSLVNKQFRADRREFHSGERKMARRRRVEYHIFDTARLLKDNECFYFAYTLDFRGRAYACSAYLSPQGKDLERGLLEFAAGETITPDGEWWLKLHLANTYGKDKDSFDDRIRWADEQSDWFCRIAARPVELVREWEDADSPWQFLAACFAWAAFKAGVPLCHLPVTVDGSCSGIQHSAGLVADADAGARVNLVPREAHEKPADIYADVAARANEILAKKVVTLDRYAHGWLHEWKVTRADTKASVMTLPYGAAYFANVKKVRASVEKQIRKGKKRRPSWLSLEPANREERSAAYRVLSDAIWEAMVEIIKAPMEVMAYFKRCAGAMRKCEERLQRAARKVGGKDGGPHLRFSWVSPCGFPVLADYRKGLKRRTELKDPNTGKRITFEFYKATDETDWEAAGNTAPPNFIHSLDASHLIRVLARSSSEGVAQVSIIHDAFGTTPSKVGALVELLLEEFVAMYSKPVLENTLNAMLEAVGAERPEAPQIGSLDLNGMRQARYAFA
jgi:DNA-directed RNA polymerase